MKKGLLFFVVTFLYAACSDPSTVAVSTPETSDFIAAVDISSFPEIAASSPVFYNRSDQETPFLDILKQEGVNTVRLRLWVNPGTSASSLEEVTLFSNELKAKGFKTWISLHFSDTWADPGQQRKPVAWQSDSFSALKQRVADYSKSVAEVLKPNFIQIGNEVNDGFLHPIGRLSTNSTQFKALLQASAAAIRAASPDTKIMLHYAGITGADWFYSQVEAVDYDIIALSYYPKWHGKDLEALAQTIHALGESMNKEVIIAETAYPFTLEWNDWTNNIIGLEEQLILPDYEASPAGQLAFMQAIRRITSQAESGIGFCYWGAELIAWKGNEPTSGSPWENQALFDFEHKALPVLSVFKE